ncbi:MAG: PKD domain-containing protein [Anaerolineae bacterium]|nr:PKD domain-containing protein [Candidatus Roseilinea sp.]MDW8448873.1 PKD domain-containing protein [Anaerolineae bacterium]
MNAFDVIALGSLAAGDLSGRDVVILAETALSDAQAALFSTYVQNGGRLVATRPDAKLAGVFGLAGSPTTRQGGYLRISAPELLAAGLATETMQIHGAIDLYNLQGGSAIAYVHNSAALSSATNHPAVVSNTFGSGQAVAFTYDLARNVAYIRQGNPALANVDVDGNGFQTTDLFQAAPGGTPWLDVTRIPVPQADEQQRLFAALVRRLVSPSRPLPQWWYFPGKAKSVLLLTADTAANPIEYFRDYANYIAAKGGKSSFFLNFNELTLADLNAMRAQEHEFGIHPPAQFNDPTGVYPITNLSQGFAVFTNYFLARFGSQPMPMHRTMGLAWEGWTGGAEIAATYGYKMDFSYAHRGAWMRLPDGRWPRGYITGSGLPMRFVRADGVMLPVYQQPTQLSDMQLFWSIPGSVEQHSMSTVLDLVQRQLDASIQRDYAALTAMTQLDYSNYGDVRYVFESLLDYARQRGVPNLSAMEWLNFIEARRAARFTDITWNEATATLSFKVSVTTTPRVTLTALIPTIYNNRSLQSVTVDGAPVAFSVDLVKAEDFAFVSMPAGNRDIIARYVVDEPITGLSATSDSPKKLGETMTFTATVASGTNVTIRWDFGDGALGSGPTTSHIYRDYGPNQGIYTVRVTARNAASVQETTIRVKVELPNSIYLPIVRREQ